MSVTFELNHYREVTTRLSPTLLRGRVMSMRRLTRLIYQYAIFN